MTTKLIKLTELRTENEKFVMKTCIVNVDKIVSVQSGMLSKKGPHIIGAERERELRMIVLAGAPAIFVDESVDEIFARLTAVDTSNWPAEVQTMIERPAVFGEK